MHAVWWLFFCSLLSLIGLGLCAHSGILSALWMRTGASGCNYITTFASGWFVHMVYNCLFTDQFEQGFSSCSQCRAVRRYRVSRWEAGGAHAERRRHLPKTTTIGDDFCSVDSTRST
jgi:hypothetical protein